MVIKTILYLMLLLAAVTANAQVTVNCCGIKQTIPIFKDDTDFNQAKYYSPLVTKKILPAINKSGPPVEIRYVHLGMDMGSDVGVIKCDNNHITVTRYISVVRMVGQPFARGGKVKLGDLTVVLDDERKYYKAFKDIRIEHPGDGLTNLVETISLTKKFKSYNWDSFFNRLVNDHFFDMPAGDAFIDSLKTIYPGNYYGEMSDPPVVIIQVKVGNHYRNLRFDDYGLPKGAPEMDLVKWRRDFMGLIRSFFINNPTPNQGNHK